MTRRRFPASMDSRTDQRRLLHRKGALAAALFVWPLIGNALLNFCQRTIVLRYCDEAISQAGIRCRVR